MDQRMSRSGGDWPSGWAVFAGAMLLLAGVLNLVHGLVALASPKVAIVSAEGYVVWDLTGWAWIHVLLGVGMVVISLGLFAVQEWARWLAVVIAIINAIAAVGFFTAYPLWATLVIALDVIVIYQLSMHWRQPPVTTT
jgi:hypothetical protein